MDGHLSFRNVFKNYSMFFFAQMTPLFSSTYLILALLVQKQNDVYTKYS
jgi:hypothetical protein